MVLFFFFLPGKILSPDRHRRRLGCGPKDRAEEVLRNGVGGEQERQEVGGGHPKRHQGQEDEEAYRRTVTDVATSTMASSNHKPMIFRPDKYSLKFPYFVLPKLVNAPLPFPVSIPKANSSLGFNYFGPPLIFEKSELRKGPGLKFL